MEAMIPREIQRHVSELWMKHRPTYIKTSGPSARAELKALCDMARKQGGSESQERRGKSS